MGDNPCSFLFTCTKNTELTAFAFARTVTFAPTKTKVKTEERDADIGEEAISVSAVSVHKQTQIPKIPTGSAHHESNRLEDIPHEIFGQGKTAQLQSKLHRLPRSPSFRPPGRLPRRDLRRLAAHRPATDFEDIYVPMALIAEENMAPWPSRHESDLNSHNRVAIATPRETVPGFN